MLDDISGDWGIPLAPVVVDARHTASMTRLSTELDNLGLDYVMRVSADLTTRHRVTPREIMAPSTNGRPAGTNLYPTPLERTTITWRPPVLPHSVRSQFAVLPAKIPPTAGRPAPDRSLLVEWPLGGTTPRDYWLTNMNDRPIAELVGLAKTLPQARRDLDDLTQSVGLGHHEGRSFIGWHHHVTLVSLAHAFLVLESLREKEQQSTELEQAVNGLFRTQLEDHDELIP
jgi:hypothetical protein